MPSGMGQMPDSASWASKKAPIEVGRFSSLNGGVIAGVGNRELVDRGLVSGVRDWFHGSNIGHSLLKKLIGFGVSA